MPHLSREILMHACTDHTSPTFQTLRDLIVAGAPAGAPLTPADAASQLSEAWNKDRDARQAIWDAQVQADIAQAEADTAAAAAQADIDRLAAEAAAAAELAALEAKKPKIGAFDETLTIPDFLGPRVSNFAKKKLEDKEYVELWYFTKEGCLDAESLRGGVEADETFGITQSGTTLALKPLTAFRASKKVVPDEDLSWDQLSVAKTGFLAGIDDASWPTEHRTAMATFFYRIENHPSRLQHDPHAEQILVMYQAKARRFWHDALAQNKGFNLAIINDKLLETVAREFHNKLRKEKYRVVSA
ncbi:hypothetical protein GGX14DRAFT_537402 [Mycena pura]|uniref:Uncharacterized protein n=1 Tax=Mycena pura TaxID=153505 RepID=A0AAD6UT66_9AGAR|nr:hypothetical protein GGX14DRAFT_537402 [Mycena pura]